jgi:hypothetical protein
MQDMSSELFSINRLAQLLEKDRATIGRLTRDVPADGRDKAGNARWKLSSIVEAMSRQSGIRGSNPRMTALADQLEQTGAEAMEVLEKLRALPTVAARRKYAQGGALTVIGRLSAAFEACAGTLKSDRGTFEIAADVVTGEAIAEVMQLCNFKIRPEELKEEAQWTHNATMNSLIKSRMR